MPETNCNMTEYYSSQLDNTMHYTVINVQKQYGRKMQHHMLKSVTYHAHIENRKLTVLLI